MLDTFRYRPGDIFETWLSYLEATVEALPGVLRRQGKLDLPNVSRQKLARQIEPILRAHETTAEMDDDSLSNYVAGTAILVQAVCSRPNFDYLGAIYSLYAAVSNSSRYPGEFYAPADVAHLVAIAALKGSRKQLWESLLDAMTKAVEAVPEYGIKILGQGLGGLTGSGQDAVDIAFQTQILPLIAPYMKPIRIYDACCGSGSLLLAAANYFPDWANYWGFIRYYGNDISEQAVRLARLNMRMFGLSGRIIVANTLTMSPVRVETQALA
jgi:hypothetical protein